MDTTNPTSGVDAAQQIDQSASMAPPPQPQVQVQPQAVSQQPAPVAQAPATPPPSPQDTEIQHSTLFGRAAKALMGGNTTYHVDQNGNTVPVESAPTFNQFARNVLSASLLGAAAGANGDPRQGFASGAARGAGAGVQQAQQQDLLKRQQAEQDFKNNQQVQQQDQQKMLMNAQVQNLHSEMAGRQHTSDLQDQEAHDAHNKASQALTKVLTDAGGTPANIPVNGKAASEFTAPDLATAYVKDPSILQGPNGFVRHFVDTTDSSNLTYNGTNWVDDAGKAVNMTDHTTVKAIDVPVNAMQTKVMVTGKDINAAYGGKLVDGDKSYPMSPMDMDGLTSRRLKEAREQSQTDNDNKRTKIQQQELGIRQQELALKDREVSLKEMESAFDANGDPSALATAMAHGQVAADRMDYLLAKKPELIQAILKVDPDFDSSKVSAYKSAYKDFTSTKPGSAGGTLVAGGTAFKHLQELQELNTLESRVPGTAAYQRYQNKVDTVAPELAKVYNDSTIPGIESYKRTLNAATNRDAAIQTQAQSMGDKIDALSQAWDNAAPSKAYHALMPKLDDKAIAARAALDPKFKERTLGSNTGQAAIAGQRQGEIPVIHEGQVVGFTMPGKTGMRPVR